MNRQINFTKRALEQISPSSEGKRLYFYDTKVGGLGLSVTPAGSKSFIVYKKHKGKPLRVTLGKFPDMTVEQARKAALNALAKLAHGVNPIDEKKEQQASQVTLQELFDAYLQGRRNLKPSTITDYHKTMRQTFSDWLNKPLHSISKEMVLKRHAQRGAESPARANNAFRVLRALFNFAQHHYEDSQGNSLFPENPVTKLSATKSWFRVQRRQTYIKRSDLAAWFQGVFALTNEHVSANAEVAKDYFIFLLLTGTRREEAARLCWSEVDLREGTFTLLNPKNHQTVTLPMSDFVLHLLKQRRAKADSIFVFPGSGAKGHIVESRRHLLHVRELSGVHFTLHDLRRTFATVGDALDISRYSLKKLLNHKLSDDTDVTAGYIVTDTDRLYRATQRITDFILQAAEIDKAGIEKRAWQYQN